MADTDIAIVGLAAHLPGARDAAQYWRNLTEGVESVRELSEEELLAAGVTQDHLRRPGYVRAAATLDGVYDFDADFFGLSPKEAGIMDPQHRHFLMASWEALEDAGHVPESFEGAIGVFAGCGMGSYFMRNLMTNADLVRDVGTFLLRHTGNDKDFLSTRASYIFDLRGPSVNVQTACSTSLVATHLAVQHLLSGECDLALAGGVTIEVPHGQGYQYHEGEVLSPDGHCRAFDRESQGTVFGSGVGVIALRRLDDAIEDGDQIYAVIKGTAVNNDGDQKVGYLAPSVDGQAACITEALAVADVEPETIGYVECHGTGTPMGDPIEVAAMTQAFGADPDEPGYCRIGSVKTNIGHLDTAAGVASVIKVALTLQHGEMPPSLNFEAPNPNLEIEQSPFRVNDELTPWPADDDTPRRAGVNSLGVGGTNAFAVLEQAPAPEPRRSSGDDTWRLLTLSARSKGALDDGAARLAAHLREHPDLDLADVAWTLQVGRAQFPERRVVAARTPAEAAELLEQSDARRTPSHTAAPGEHTLTFMFPGGGAQHLGMGADLYRAEPTFARHVDEGLRLLDEVHGLDLRPLLLPDSGTTADAATVEQLALMAHQLPLIFIVEFALAQLLIERGLTPTALVGHSLGENTAACVAGTMSFADCLGLVVLRGQLMDRVEGGAVSVALPPEDLAEQIDRLGLDLAVVNNPELTVVSGSIDALDTLEAELRADGVEPLRVPVTTPVHSRLLDPVLAEFRAYLEGIELHAPSIPWVSNSTGKWISAEEATDAAYWVDHLRHTVRFSDCIATLAEDPGRILLEVGPGRTLSSLVRMHPDLKASQAAIAMMRHPDEAVADDAALLTAIGRIWAAGGPLDVDRLVEGAEPRRVGLPAYAFQTQTFFIAPGTQSAADDDDVFLAREPDEERWAWKPVWSSRDREEPVDETLDWLVVADGIGVADDVVTRLRARGDRVVVLRSGDSYRAISDEEYLLSPELGELGYDQLVRDLVRTGRAPDRVAHLGLLATDDRSFRPGSSFFHRNQELGFQSLVHFARAWADAGLQRPLHLSVATMGAQLAPGSSELRWPEQSTVLGPVQVIPHEFEDVTASTFDLDPDELRRAVEGRTTRGGRRWELSDLPTNRADLVRLLVDGPTVDLVGEVLAELLQPVTDEIVAIRGDRRYVRDVRHVRLPEHAPARLRRDGVAVITGGLGGIGLSIAEELHRSSNARLALLSRSELPDRSQWDELVGRLGDAHPTSERIARIRALEAAGAEVLLLAADVTDPDSVGRALDRVRATFGAVHAVVHAAGVIDDGLMVTKTATQMDDVLAPKVYGTLVLETATSSDPLDLFVVFSSTSTVTAPMGQVDYVSANAFLNAFAQSRAARGDDHVRAIDWGVWNEVGMAAASARDDSADTTTDSKWDASHPFFDAAMRTVDGTVRITARWEPERDWVFDDHRTAAGEALLPGSAYPELVRGALEELGVTRAFQLRDLTFLRPLAAHGSDPVTARVTLTPSEHGYRVDVAEAVEVERTTAEGGSAAGAAGWRRTSEAEVLLYEQTPPDDLDLDAIAAACPRRGPVRTRQQDHLRFGPRWDVVDRVQYGQDTAIAWLHLDDAFTADLDPIGLHPALVDLGTGFAMDLVEDYTGDQLWVPVSYRRITVFDRLPAQVVSIVSARPGSSESTGLATFDVTLCDPSGRVLVVVDGFTIKRLDGALELSSGRRALAVEVELEADTARERQASLSELAFQQNLAQGITPEEGRRLFARATAATDLPVVYLTTLDLHDLRRQSDRVAASQIGSGSSESSAVFARPQLDSEYLEPRNDVEEQLVTMWQDLLGIDQIGVRDDFFDLGGHSLIAVRLFAQVKRTFSVDFPISLLVEAPTIEAVAARIGAAMPASESDAGAEATLADAPPRYRHLVPMHPGDGVSETPFFLVAGMFGNVLNLRHLAHQIGADRPFYGVQARGLFGDDDPHETFEEMATDYLDEVRSVQPHGPYLLGGFSGGGIAALEMAQQLHAAGEEVSLLVMLDTPVPYETPLTARDRAQLQWQKLRESGIGYVKEWAVNRVEWEKEKRRRAEGAAATDEGALHSEVIESAFYRALERYQLRPYHGVISLYRPKLRTEHVLGPDRQIDINRRFVQHDNGWGPHCDRVEVTEVPGDHDSMVLEPSVRVLAGHIRAAIEEADTGHRAVHAVRASAGA
ncbi:MAG: SDR family NAD(P)-dependent oxidoreductase [Actinomycetota bacterium]|nr:SDR family NAD(P)-dependent oxidoreductase [Actinomycetota bacterium]